MNILRLPLFLVAVLPPVLSGCASSGAMTRTYFEYSRGKSFPTHSDVRFRYGNNDYTLHNLYLEDKSWDRDESIIPNAFVIPLFTGHFGEAVADFTEPYYSYRLIHFLKNNPHIGLGLEFVHLKVVLLDPDQRVRMTGMADGAPIDATVTVGDYLGGFNVSHGVNHAGVHFVYRWLLKKTPEIADGRLQPYVNASFGPAVPHLELKTNDNGVVTQRAYSYNTSFKNWGGGVGAGVRYKISRLFGLYMEYKLTYSHLRSMRFDDIDDTNVTMSFWTNHLQWGLSVMFNP